MSAVSCTYTSAWSAYTQTESTPLPISVADITNYYPEAAGYTPDQIETLVNGDAAHANYQVWECIYMGADPTNPATYIDQFTAYVALLDVENLTFAAVPAYGLNGGPFTLWGRVFMDEGEWVNLGDPSTSPAVTSNQFFRLEQ